MPTQRYYFTGQTCGVRDRLRAAGCYWDPLRKAWWTGEAEVAEQCGGAPAAGQTAHTPCRRDKRTRGEELRS